MNRLLTDEEIINLVTAYHLSGKQNRHILARKVAKAQDTKTYKIAFDEGVKKTTDACESTFSEMLKEERAKSVKATIEIVDDLLDSMGLGIDNFPLSAWNEWEALKRGIDEQK